MSYFGAGLGFARLHENLAGQRTHAADMEFYQSLGGLGLIVYPTKYGVTSLLRYDRARAALKNRKTRAFHRRPGLT